MDLLRDANVYQIARGHVDAVYENGETIEEKRYTKRLVKLGTVVKCWYFITN